MNKTAPLLLAVIAVSIPAAAQKITMEYAHEFDFSSVETFRYVRTAETDAPDNLSDNRIKNTIIRELFEGGLNSASSNPDLVVTYHLTTKENSDWDTTSFGYGGYFGGWGPWGGGKGTATITRDTLIVDAWEPAGKTMVWRGTGAVKSTAKPEKRQKQIIKILSKLGKKWDKILAGKGK